jgi:hypothetical protein
VGRIRSRCPAGASSQPIDVRARLTQRMGHTADGAVPRSVGGRHTLGVAKIRGCNPPRYLDVSTLGLQCSCTGPSVPNSPFRPRGRCPLSPLPGGQGTRRRRHSDVAAARLQPRRAQMQGIEVTPASRTPEMLSPPRRDCRATPPAAPQPTVLPGPRTGRPVAPCDQSPVTPPPILR